MNRLLPIRMLVLLFCSLTAVATHAAGNLSVHDAWIKLATAGETVSYGYATLGNVGDAPLHILTVQSDAFRAASLLNTVTQRGSTSTREMISLEIPPGGVVSLQPGAKQLMLTDPRHPIAPGDQVHIVFLLGDGTRVPANFDVPVANKPPS